jgi:hypothetical protein
MYAPSLACVRAFVSALLIAALAGPVVGAEARNSPSGTLTGTVTDTAGHPVQGATVSAGDNQVVTDAAGKYTLVTDAGPHFNAPAGAVGTVTGVVNNVTTGKPAPTALITDGQGEVMAAADANGAFSVPLGSDDYLVTASGAGYFSGSPVSFTIYGGDNQNITLLLFGSPIPQPTQR